jgi:hypothetical protein
MNIWDYGIDFEEEDVYPGAGQGAMPAGPGNLMGGNQSTMMERGRGAPIQGGVMAEEAFPQIPTPPKTRGPQGDPSAMAAYGMEAPPLPGPMAQLKVLMDMQQPRQQRQQMPQGNLMSYLMQLGGL